MNTRVRNIKHLIQLLEKSEINQLDVFVKLGMVKSSKHLWLLPKGNIQVYHEIDDRFECISKSALNGDKSKMRGQAFIEQVEDGIVYAEIKA